MRKTYLITSIVIFILVILILVLSFFAGNLAEAEVRAYLKKHPPKGFRIEFEDIGVRIWSRSVRVKGINILSTTDSISMHKPGLEPESLKIRSIELSGIRIIKALKGEDFKIGRIAIKDPQLLLLTEGSIFSAKKSIEKSKETRSDTAHHKLFKSLHVGRFILENGELNVMDSISSKSLLSAKKLGLELEDITLDSSLKVLGASEIDVSVYETNLTLPGDLYELQFSLLKVAKYDSSIRINRLKLIPLYPEYEFARKFGKQTDRFSVEIERLGIEGVHFDSLLSMQNPNVRLVEIDSLYVSIFRDKSVPFDFSNFPKLPHEALRTMEKPMTIEKVTINDGYAEYYEHEIGAEEPGMVFFDRINGSILNITSDSSRISQNPVMEVHARMMLYGKGEMDASINMPLNDPMDNFTFKAEVGTFEVSEANRMIKPGNMVDVSKGTIDKLTLTGSASPYLGKGNMTMLYHDLEIELLKENKEGQLKRKWFMSTVANEIVKSANPLRNQPAREVSMYFERDMNKGIINFLWKTCFSGIKETLKPTKHIKEDTDKKQGRNK
jgi:hypothetical protein